MLSYPSIYIERIFDRALTSSSISSVVVVYVKDARTKFGTFVFEESNGVDLSRQRKRYMGETRNIVCLCGKEVTNFEKNKQSTNLRCRYNGEAETFLEQLLHNYC